MNLKSQLTSAWRTKHLYQQWGTFLSWCKTFSVQIKLQFIPWTFFWFWKPGNTTLWGAQVWELLPNSVTLHTTNTSATFPCGTSILTALPHLLSPNPTSCIWEHYGCLPYNKRFCGRFVISQGPSLLGVGVHRDTCWVPVPHGPGLTGTTIWHTDYKNSYEAPN